MIEAGSKIPQRVFWVDRALLKRYADASGDQNPIHQDQAFAVNVGLPNVIAHGMLTMGLVATYISDWAGGAANVKEYGARFTKPVIVPEGQNVDLTVDGTVAELLADGAIRIELTATSAGVKVLGMAKAVVIKKS
jgi:acyl dehydratase